MARMVRLQNRIKQIIYRPGKSRFLSKDAIGKFTGIDKTIKSSLGGLLEGMGYVSDKEDKDGKDGKDESEKEAGSGKEKAASEKDGGEED